MFNLFFLTWSRSRLVYSNKQGKSRWGNEPFLKNISVISVCCVQYIFYLQTRYIKLNINRIIMCFSRSPIISAIFVLDHRLRFYITICLHFFFFLILLTLQQIKTAVVSGSTSSKCSFIDAMMCLIGKCVCDSCLICFKTIWTCLHLSCFSPGLRSGPDSGPRGRHLEGSSWLQRALDQAPDKQGSCKALKRLSNNAEMCLWHSAYTTGLLLVRIQRETVWSRPKKGM